MTGKSDRTIQAVSTNALPTGVKRSQRSLCPRSNGLQWSLSWLTTLRQGSFDGIDQKLSAKPRLDEVHARYYSGLIWKLSSIHFFHAGKGGTDVGPVHPHMALMPAFLIQGLLRVGESGNASHEKFGCRNARPSISVTLVPAIRLSLLSSLSVIQSLSQEHDRQRKHRPKGLNPRSHAVPRIRDAKNNRKLKHGRSEDDQQSARRSSKKIQQNAHIGLPVVDVKLIDGRRLLEQLLHACHRATAKVA